MTTIERLTKAGRKLGLKGQAGQNGGKTIPYSREAESRLRNVSELPHGTGARYLLAIRGEGTDLVAQAWKRTAPSVLKPSEVLIDFAKPRIRHFVGTATNLEA